MIKSAKELHRKGVSLLKESVEISYRMLELVARQKAIREEALRIDRELKRIKSA